MEAVVRREGGGGEGGGGEGDGGDGEGDGGEDDGNGDGLHSARGIVLTNNSQHGGSLRRIEEKYKEGGRVA